MVHFVKISEHCRQSTSKSSAGDATFYLFVIWKIVTLTYLQLREKKKKKHFDHI